ncbi:MAG: molybdenum cofactor biosynthesis protein MoaE [Gammaproteobacteria bacterium]|nr:molybdenum cofactor biosynthesis protein MoaE [Gammaproteobacteria bacterium]
MISVQEEDFSNNELFEQLKLNAGNNAGAICSFTGLVREVDQKDQSKLIALSLEHYPGMTEKALSAIAEDAKNKFSLSSIIIVHRVGKLSVGERIVYVGTSSVHRKSAFDGCEYIMDFLKNDAPFWKKEFREDGCEKWIEQKQTDRDAVQKWD